MQHDLVHLSNRHLIWFVLLSMAGVALLGTVWKFGIEEWADPYLPGDHVTDSVAERWEFVIMASLMTAIALLYPLIVVKRLVAERLVANRLAAVVFKTAPQPMVVTDRRKHVIAANLAFEKLTGFSEASIIGETIAFLKSDLQGDSFYRELSDALDKNGNWSGEVRNRRPDGTQYVVLLVIEATRDASGQISELIGVMTDITWRKQQEEETLHLATHDALSGLANRRLFIERLDQLLASAQVSAERVGVLFVDLDGFKHINDTLGHAVGDSVLRAVGTSLLSCARSADLVARLGGDEFVILMRNVEADATATLFAQRCIDLISAVSEVDGHSIRIGASIGIALSFPGRSSAQALLDVADKAMYRAKRSGKGVYRLEAHAVEQVNAAH